MKNTIYILSRDNKEIYRNTDENECYFKLQRSQSQSANWAMKYEGWRIETLSEFKKRTGQKAPEKHEHWAVYNK